MRGICPNCEKESDLELVHTFEDINVRGELIKVAVDYYRCASCGQEFEDPRSSDDSVDRAYREYRQRHGMTQPEEIRNFRNRHGLTQNELSCLLGWGGATLSRYENGALQDDAHEKTLRLAMDPHNLLRLIHETPEAMSPEKRTILAESLSAAQQGAYPFEALCEERFGNYEPSVLSGYRKLDLRKLFNAILFFCREGVAKTTLNKLLFYADFKHFKEYIVSISGARYIRIPFGPAPVGYQHYFASLTDDRAIEVEPILSHGEPVGENFVAVKKPDLSIFSNSELKVLAEVKEHFKDFGAVKISKFSHEEKGYLKTPTGHVISYEYASELKI